MKPFFLTIRKDLPLMIIPDSDAHSNGHTILTYSYSIYLHRKKIVDMQVTRELNLHLEKKNDPDYLGTIVFETPGRSLNYIADGKRTLSPFEIQELVDKITAYRNTPAMWTV